MKEIVRKVLLSIYKKTVLKYRYIIKEINKKKIKKILLKSINKSLTIIDEENWIEKLNVLTYTIPDGVRIEYAFATSEIFILKQCEIKADDILTICVEKNDLIKIKKFITHHRKLGFNKFIILDNNSNDGSIEWLTKQDDVFLLQTKIPYTNYRRIGWINRIIAHFGCDRWYFIADSDELLVFNDCENKRIKDLIDYYKKSNIVRARALLLDMYAKTPYYINGNPDNYYNEMFFFDANSYYSVNRNNIDNIYGGMRYRIFNIKTCLTKYPLIYFRKEDIICNSHYLYPFKDNLKSECNLILKHYKFLPNDYKKYEKIAKEGNYYRGSKEYKKYISVMKNNVLNFIYNGSNKYENSSSLEKISVYKKINWL